MIVIFLHLKSPKLELHVKLARIDWMQVYLFLVCVFSRLIVYDSGNILVIGSSTACALALTWGGTQFSWSSAQTLVPLVLGLAGFVVFVFYEVFCATEPVVRTISYFAASYIASQSMC